VYGIGLLLSFRACDQAGSVAKRRLGSLEVGWDSVPTSPAITADKQGVALPSAGGRQFAGVWVRYQPLQRHTSCRDFNWSWRLPPERGDCLDRRSTGTESQPAENCVSIISMKR
jgi:hypothetical protein